MRYTCNKKEYPIFEEDCKHCHEYNPCAKGGKWCFVAVAQRPSKIECADAANHTETLYMPAMRDMSTVTINIGDGNKIDILREDITKQLKRNLYVGFGMPEYYPSADS